MHTVPVLMLLAGAVILAGVIAVAMGHGGEMAEFPSDYVPPALGGLLTAADVAMLRPPPALWGYNTQVTDEALTRIAQIVTERDVEIAVLRQQLADVRTGGTAPASAARADPEPPAVDEPALDEPAPAAADAGPAAADAGAAAGAGAVAGDEAPVAPTATSGEAAAPGDD